MKESIAPQERQAKLVERYSIIPDPQERLAAIISRKSALPGVPEEERADEYLVPGCQSRVWIIGSLKEGRCHFRVEADSALVRGLITLLCEVYDGATPVEIVATEPELFEKLGIAAILTPTRLNGLAAVRLYLRNFAAASIDR